MGIRLNTTISFKLSSDLQAQTLTVLSDESLKSGHFPDVLKNGFLFSIQVRYEKLPVQACDNSLCSGKAFWPYFSKSLYHQYCGFIRLKVDLSFNLERVTKLVLRLQLIGTMNNGLTANKSEACIPCNILPLKKGPASVFIINGNTIVHSRERSTNK